jgi:gliding motility-associated lipoprotein GldH
MMNAVKYNFSVSLILIAVLSLSMSSCNSDIILDEKYAIPEYGWAYSEQAAFEFEIEDTTALYRMAVDIDHSTEFPFQNIYLRIHSVFPNDTTNVILHSVELQEPNGQWIGGCSGEDCSVRVILSENMYFNQTGKHKISFEQYTRRDSLKGIENWGLILEKMGTKPTELTPVESGK